METCHLRESASRTRERHALYDLLNLELSCAVAQTLVAPASLPRAWPRLRSAFPAYSCALAELIAHTRPSLAAALPAADDPPPPASPSPPPPTDPRLAHAVG